MYLGKVIGTVVSTVKVPNLTGSKLLIVEKINQDLTAKKQTEIAVDTVMQYLKETGSQMKVIFNVYKDMDLTIYRELLNRN